MDAQSVKTVEESARISGYNAYKRIKGRKRHLLVDTPGLPISVSVTPADMHDTQGACRLLAGLNSFVSRLKKIWADSAYRGQELADWCQAQGNWDLEMVERTFGWLSRYRRMSKDYERKVQTSETLIKLVAMRLLLRRLARQRSCTA